MKNLIKLIVVSLCLFVFSTPVLASDYAHTIEQILFQGYKEYGVSITVTTNIDTEKMQLYTLQSMVMKEFC